MDAARVLRTARLQADLSQAELARRAGTSQATLSAYESGRKVPSLDTFERLLAETGNRLAVTPGKSTVIRPSRTRHAKTARSLLDVLALAEALPSRHAGELRYPR